MKKLLFILFFFFLSICSYAQVTHFQAEVIAYKISEAPWTEWEENHDAISVDLTNMEILIKDDIYIIVKNEEPEEKQETVNLVFLCLLGERDKYYIEFVIYKRQKIRQLYIRKDNKQIVYQMIKI